MVCCGGGGGGGSGGSDGEACALTSMGPVHSLGDGEERPARHVATNHEQGKLTRLSLV